MPTTLEYMKFSLNVYSASPLENIIGVPFGWTRIDWQPDMTSGFSAGTFVNGNEVVISYTGTNDFLLDTTLGWTIGAGLPMPQIFDAIDYYFEVKAAHPNANIIFSGHSLGAGLASLMAVYFNKSATVFDEAPFQLAALNPVVTDAVAAWMLTKGYSDNAFSDYILSAGALALTRESAINHYYLEGESLEYIRLLAPNLVGNSFFYDKGNSNAGSTELHSMALLTAVEASDAFHNALKKLPSLVSLLADNNLFGADPTTDNPDLLRRLLRHQFGVEGSVEVDNMLTRFASDMAKLAQEGGLTMTDNDAAISNTSNVSKALIAFAMQMYYEDTPAAKDATKQLFTAVTGGVQFDMADVSQKILAAFTQSNPIVLSDAKGYKEYFSQYINGSESNYSIEERNLINTMLASMRDWYVQAGASGMDTTDDHNRHAFMLGGAGNDNLTGGNKADLLVGNAGNDTLNGGDGDDVILGVTGNDALNGDDGNDWLNGGQGSDDLNGGAGNDILEGDATDGPSGGLDTLDGGEGNDQLKGGWGHDTYKFTGSFGTDIVTDSDGFGSILINGQAINSANRKFGNIYKDETLGYTFTLLNNGESIAITKENDDNRIIINNYSPTNTLGINLTGEAPAAPAATLTGDFKKKINPGENAGTEDDTYEIEDNNYVKDDAETNALDLINGTAGKDAIYGLGGDDYLNGKEGEDYIEGGNGGDYIQGGMGKDTLNGGAGDDSIYGSSDFDIDMPTDVNFTKPVNEWTHRRATGFNWVSGYNASDLYSNGTPSGYTSPAPRNRLADDQGNFIDGGEGNDFIAAGTGADYVHGGADKDHIWGMDKGDILFGDGGNDVIYGDGNKGNDSNSVVWTLPQDHGNDIIDGGDGDDILFGQGKDDIIFGGNNNDKIWGDEQKTADLDPNYHGNDYIDGGNGDDQIVGGGKNDILMGGDGDDKIWGDDAEVNLAEEFHGNDMLYGGAGNDYLYGGAGNDTLDGGDDDDQLFGGDGNDTLITNSGNDVLAGGANDDTYLINSTGVISIIDNEGNDKIRFGANNNPANLKLRLGSLLLDFGNGSQVHIENFNQNDVFNSTSFKSFEFANGTSLSAEELLARGFDLDGSAANDTITGTNTTDRISGLAGNDIIQAGAGNDALYGGLGDDSLQGGDGADLLNGDVGDDVMAGGVGDDVYTLDIGDGFDSIDDAQGINRISFGAGISRDTLHVSQYQGDDGSYYLQVAYGSSGDKVAIKNGLAGAIQGYQFEDGTYISHAELIGNEGIPFHVYGTQNADTLIGTGSGDAIEGNDGDDVLLGLDGDDTLLGGLGSDNLKGGVGNDVLDGGLGHDVLEGGDGQDSYLMYWGMGLDSLIEVSGSDTNNLKLHVNITVSDLTYQRVGSDLNLYLGANEGVQIKDYFNGGQQWQIVDDQNNAISVDDFIATPVSNDLSTVQQLMNKYQRDMKAQYYSELGQAGYVQGVDGKFTKTEYTSGSSYSRFDYHINDFVIVDQQSNDIEILAYNNGEYNPGYIGADYYGGNDYLRGYIDQYQLLSETVTRTAIYTGSGYSSSFSSGTSGSSSPIFIPNNGGGSSHSVSGSGSSPYVVTNGGVWYLATQNGGGSGGAPASQYTYFTKSEYQVDGTQFFVNLQAGDSDNLISAQNRYAIVDAGEGNDQIGLEVIPNSYEDIIYDYTFAYDHDYYPGFYSGLYQFSGGFLYGNTGNDTIYGEKGQDVLLGGEGVDYLDGQRGADTYMVLATDTGIDTINDSAYLTVPYEGIGTGYMDWYYKSIGIDNWQELFWPQEGSEQSSLPDLPEISALEYDLLEPLYAAGVIEKDTVEFGAGINLADLSIAWGQNHTLEILWAQNKGVKIVMPVVDLSETINEDTWGVHTADATWHLGAGVEQFRFADGTLLSMADMIALAPPMPNFKPIVFGVGDGVLSVAPGWATLIKFDASIIQDDITVTHDGYDLLINHSNGLDQLRIENWYQDPENYPAIKAVFNDGTFLSAEDLTQFGLIIEGTNGADTLNSIDGVANTFYGLDGDDVITGGTGNEEIYGGNGGDTMTGGAGNDFLYGGLGDDTLVGGAGDDIYYFALGDGHEQIDNTAADNVTAIDKIYLEGIDHAGIVLNRVSNDLKIVINAENSITIKNYYASTDSKIDQIQFYFYDANTDTYTDTIWDNAQIEVMATAAEINHAPTIIGSLSDVNVIDGNALSMALPVDSLFEDTDVDDQLTYTVTTADGEVLPTWLSFDPTTLSIAGTPNGSDIGTLALQVTATDIAGASAHINFNLSVAAMADQVLTGTSGNDVLTGGSGNDTLNGLAGTDTMRGGYGDDNYYVERLADKVLEDANQGSDTINSTVTYTLSANVENLVLLGTASITANGNELDNQLTGNAGSNTLDGKTGKDQMVGGLGNDIYIVDDIGDVVTELENEGTDTVKSSVDYVLGDHVERLTLTGTDAISGIGNDLNNLIIGNDSANQISGEEGNDTLNGGLGADTLIGGLGNDIYVVDDALDTITEQEDEGTDTVQSSITYTLGDNLERLTLTGTEAIDGMGNALNNILVGNAASNTLSGLAGNDTITGGSSDDILIGGDGNDTLNGGLGADLLIGGLGNDLYTIDEVGDTITEALNEGTDRVNSAINYVLGAHIENLTLTGTSAINGTGNELNNTITGNAADNQLSGNEGNDSLNGGLGADIMIGGLGNDIYTVDNVNDIVVEQDNEGTDRVNSSISYALGDYLENLTLTGSVDINGFGNQLSNVLSGNTGHNYLFGLDGNDTLTGNTGNDVLQGGEGADILNSNAGNDLLDGGVGADKLNGGTESDFFIGGLSNDTITTGTGYDVIAFNKGDGQDIINASTGADNTISLGGDFAYSDLSLTKVSNNLILKVGATDQITLKDWYLGTTNKSVVNLQVIAESMTAFSLGGADALRDNKVENFNFANMVAAFDAEGAIANWQLTDERLTAHLNAGSDTAAIGGDLAYQYGKNSNLTGMGLLNTQSVIAAASFGQTAQTLNDPSVWQAEVVKLG